MDGCVPGDNSIQTHFTSKKIQTHKGLCTLNPNSLPAQRHACRLPVCHHQVCGPTRWGHSHHFRFRTRRKTQFLGVSMCHAKRGALIRQFYYPVTFAETLKAKLKAHFMEVQFCAVFFNHGTSFDPNPLRRHTFWTISIGGTFVWSSIYGINQAQVQRYISCKSISQARL